MEDRVRGRFYLSPEQAEARGIVLAHAQTAMGRCAGDFKAMFIEGPSGTGKTELINHVLDVLRLRGEACVVCATTALAASLYEGGDTVHAMAKLTVTKRSCDPIECKVTKRSDRAELLQHAIAIFLDEVSSLHRANLEIVWKMLEEVGFRGVLVLAGDFQQVRQRRRLDALNVYCSAKVVTKFCDHNTDCTNCTKRFNVCHD